MGELIIGPWGKPKAEEAATASNDVPADDASNYPWYALCTPKGTKPDKETLASLKKLARLAGPSGQLVLPDGWTWNFQSMIDQLNRIAALGAEEEDVPDDCA